MSLTFQMRRLARHSAIYGLGGILSRLLAVFLLPLYTSYLGTRGFGKIEIVTALTTVVVIVLTAGISSAFFRFYFDSTDPERRVLIVSDRLLVHDGHGDDRADRRLCVRRPDLASPRARERSLARARGGGRAVGADELHAAHEPVPRRGALGAVRDCERRQHPDHGRSHRTARRRPQEGATGAVVGNFTGTLAVYLVLLAYRRYQLGLQFDRKLLREMNRFGLPLVPSALALWAISFVDRLFVNAFKGLSEAGVYSLAVRASSVVVFVMIAFRLAWPAFAYSIEDDTAAKRTYSFVLTYLLFICSWISLALGALAPWIVKILAPSSPAFHRADEAVGLLAFATTAYAGYTVLAIGIGRARRTQFNWIVTGAAAVVNIALNFALIPPYGMMGAAVSTAAAYVTLFLGMAVNTQRVYPVAYQWRRVATLSAVAIVLATVGYELHSLPISIVLCLIYPLLLVPFGFYLPDERAKLRRLAPIRG